MTRRFATTIALFFLISTARAQGWQCAMASGLRVELGNLDLKDTWLAVDDRLERSLILLDACPGEFLAEMTSYPKTRFTWIEGLSSYTKTDTANRGGLLKAMARDAERRWPHNNDVAAAIVEGLRAAAGDNATTSPRQLRQELLRRALDDTLRDWKRRDGELAFWLSDDLVFLLALDPSYFAGTIEGSPDSLDQWLAQVNESFTSFGEEPEDKERIEQFRSQLIASLEKRHPRGTLARILQRLKDISVRVID